MMPCTLSKPAGFITVPTLAETLLTYCTGCQSMSATLRIAWAANLGVAMLKNTLAPARLELDDLRIRPSGSVTSKVTCLTTRPASLPRPSLKPSQ